MSLPKQGAACGECHAHGDLMQRIQNRDCSALEIKSRQEDIGPCKSSDLARHRLQTNERDNRQRGSFAASQMIDLHEAPVHA
jgi:hypothetical protein